MHVELFLELRGRNEEKTACLVRYRGYTTTDRLIGCPASFKAFSSSSFSFEWEFLPEGPSWLFCIVPLTSSKKCMVAEFSVAPSLEMVMFGVFEHYVLAVAKHYGYHDSVV